MMSFRTGVEVGLQRAYAALLTLFGASWTALALQGLGGTGPVGGAPMSTAAAVAFVVTAAVLAVRGVRTKLGPTDVVVVTLVAAAVQIGFLMESPAGLVVGYRTQPGVAALVPLLTLTARRYAVPGAIGVVGLQMVTSIPTDGVFAAALGVWPLVVAGSIAAGMAPALRTAGARADSAADAEREARVAADVATAERDAAAEFARILHDDVSAALRGAATPTVHATERRAEARRALAALDGSAPTPPVGGEIDVREVLGSLPGGIPRRNVLPERGVLVPAEVADAVRGAAREALRNIDRHSGAGTVRVVLSDGPGLCVTISDDGVGFDLAGAASSSGIAGSIVDRMRAVGGSATVHSIPGCGTTVCLEWVAEPPELRTGPAPVGRVALLVAATGDVRRPLFAVTVGYLATMGLVALLQPGQVPEARWFLLWYAVVCALTVVLIVRARDGVGPAFSAVAVAVAVGGAVASVVVVPVGDLLTFASWPVGAVTPLLTVLVMVRPSREALLAVLAEQTGLVLVLAIGPMAGVAVVDVVLFAVPMLVAPALGTLMGWLLGRTIRRLGRATIEANHRRVVVDAVSAADRVRRVTRDRRIEGLHREVYPFLTAVAAGTDDPVARRDTAERLDTAIRDELHLPGVLDRQLRDAVDAARASGCRIVLQSSAGMRFDAGRVAALLRPVLTGALPEEIVLGLHDDGHATTASLVVVPGRELVAPGGTLVAVRESSADYAWVEVVVSR